MRRLLALQLASPVEQAPGNDQPEENDYCNRGREIIEDDGQKKNEKRRRQCDERPKEEIS